MAVVTNARVPVYACIHKVYAHECMCMCVRAHMHDVHFTREGAEKRMLLRLLSHVRTRDQTKPTSPITYKMTKNKPAKTPQAP